MSLCLGTVGRQQGKMFAMKCQGNRDDIAQRAVSYIRHISCFGSLYDNFAVPQNAVGRRKGGHPAALWAWMVDSPLYWVLALVLVGVSYWFFRRWTFGH